MSDRRAGSGKMGKSPACTPEELGGGCTHLAAQGGVQPAAAALEVRRWAVPVLMVSRGL